MHQRIQDAMTYVRKFGRPALYIFITMTCNPAWQEIKDALLPTVSAQERPDIVARVFNLKKKEMMDQLTKNASLDRSEHMFALSNGRKEDFRTLLFCCA